MPFAGCPLARDRHVGSAWLSGGALLVSRAHSESDCPPDPVPAWGHAGADRGSGGGGNRTPVPKHFNRSLYVRSCWISFSARGRPISRPSVRPAPLNLARVPQDGNPRASLLFDVGCD